MSENDQRLRASAARRLNGDDNKVGWFFSKQMYVMLCYVMLCYVIVCGPFSAGSVGCVTGRAFSM